MSFNKMRTKFFVTLALAAALALVVPLLISCGSGGSSSYSHPSSSVQVMITPQTLNNLATNGYGTDSQGYSKLVILDVDSAASYATGHIPGSYNLDTAVDLQTTRSNGVSFTVNQVATKEMMDALIQRTGIDAHTVIVLVGNGNMMNVGRAYFNFRYWGFPKERLRVLNGTKNATYVTGAGYTLSTTATPLPAASTYSVAQLTPDVSVRATLEDMIGYAQDADPLTVIIDSRSDNEYNGIIRQTKVDTSVPTYVAFEGHMATAVHQEYTTLQVGGGGANPLLAEDDLFAAMEAIGLSEDATGISYCRTSWRAAMQFLALDAVLGWPAKIYDGAWIQWGQMASNDSLYDGSLESDSPWITTGLTEDLTYNKLEVAPIVGADSNAANANAINETDKAVCLDAGVVPNNRDVDVMIDPSTLLAWVDAGLPDDAADGLGDNPYPADYTQFVMLQVDSTANYNAGHIPGAFLLNSASADLYETRSNGIADTVNQVPTQASMDTLIQRTGIDANTIIVFYTTTASSNMMSLGRAYFNFRYWGFPKEQLRVLDGNTAHWLAAGGAALSTVATADVVSAYSVCNLKQDVTPDEVRAPFEEMFAVAADDDVLTVVADARSTDEYNGVAGKTKVAGSTYVAFEGHVRTALHQEWTTLVTNADGIGYKLLPTADLTTAMTAIGASDATTVYTYCRTSWRAAVNFLALDAVLGWPVKIYDGAWIQWGQMATNDTTVDGSLDPTSPWRTDDSAHSSPVTYNKAEIEQVGTNSYAPHANLINTEDGGTGISGGGAGGSGGGASTPPSAPGYN
jgi:3-mercaptopyruvate sulfurtransferase SseA